MKILKKKCSVIDILKVPNKHFKTHDILIGGFPCQSFSISAQNPKRLGYEDPRGKLFFEMCRVLKAKKPRVFVAENVKGLMNMQGGNVMQLIFKDFQSIGYNVNYKLLNAADYGVPQQRERIFIIGNRIGVENPYPIQTHADFSKIQNGQIKLELNKRDLNPYIAANNATIPAYLLDDPNTKEEPYAIADTIINPFIVAMFVRL